MNGTMIKIKNRKKKRKKEAESIWRSVLILWRCATHSSMYGKQRKSKAAPQFMTKVPLACQVTLQGLLQSQFIPQRRIGSIMPGGGGHPLTSLDGSVEVLDHAYHGLLLVHQDLLVNQQVTQKS